MKKSVIKRQYCSFFLTGLLLAPLLGLGMGQAQQLEGDPYVTEQKFQRMAERSKEKQTSATGNAQASPQKLILKGSVQTIEAAIQAEKATVDWYGWYMDARGYLAATGGLPCAVGTPIKFYKDGRIAPQTEDLICLLSVQNRSYPLPKNTQLSAVILPVRGGKEAPATPDEILRRTNGGR